MFSNSIFNKYNNIADINISSLHNLIKWNKLEETIPNVEVEELSFSQLKRIKNELRIIMLQERLKYLLILCIKSHIL